MKAKMNAEEMYATMNPWRLFFVVALPGLVSMLAMSLYNVVEGIFIGRILGESAFAAVNIALPLVMINFSVADLIGVGASAPISIALGRNDRKTANNIFTCSIIMIFVASAVMGVIMFATYYFQSIMQTGLATAIALLRGLIVSGILILVLPLLRGLDGIWWGMVLTEIVVAVISFTGFHNSKQRLLKIFPTA